MGGLEKGFSIRIEDGRRTFKIINDLFGPFAHFWVWKIKCRIGDPIGVCPWWDSRQTAI